jgi:hypothetical protein
MRCTNCGTEQPNTARFCGECGAPLRAITTPPAAPAQPTPPSQSAQQWIPPESPPQPQWMAPQPYATDYDTFRRISAEQKSFTTPAIITLVLYFVLWLPGLIANIVYLNEANNVQRLSGRAPEGKGCLIAMLIVFVGLPVVGFCLIVAVGMAGA